MTVDSVEQWCCDRHKLLGCVPCLQEAIRLRMDSVRRDCGVIVKTNKERWPRAYQLITKEFRYVDDATIPLGKNAVRR